MAEGPVVEEAKTPLMLVPGLLCDERLWWHQAEHLRDLAEPVIADVTQGASVSEMAQDVLEAAPAERFALAGLSMGGYVALEIMRVAPERVTRLTLLDTTARADTPEQTEGRLELIKLAQEGLFQEVPRRLLPRIVRSAAGSPGHRAYPTGRSRRRSGEPRGARRRQSRPSSP